MSESQTKLLLCTNGSQAAQGAVGYGVWLAETLPLPVVLFGIVERTGDRAQVQAHLHETEQSLAEKQIPFQKIVTEGSISEEIANQARQGEYITIVGPFGKPAWIRWVRGRTFRRLLALVPTPLLYVPAPRIPIKRILVCMGGLGYAFSMEHTILALAQQASASVTLLNIVEPITLDYQVSREVHDHLEDLIETDTPQGRTLRKALVEVRAAGLHAEVKVRHGTIVHEILEEIRAGDYDLVGMGSPYSAHSLRHLYVPNVTAEVAEAIDRPVLTVRAGYEFN